jgi:galactonate dehydratase
MNTKLGMPLNSALQQEGERQTGSTVIERIEPILIDAGVFRSWLIVKVTTNNGVTGIGEATLEGRSATVAAAIAEMGRYLVGKNAFQIERHFQYLYRGQFWKGGAILMSALSGVEQALWDIVGKVLNQPVYVLLGGAVRERARLYANGWMGGLQSIDDVAEKAHLLVTRGFGALKLPGFEVHSELSGKASYHWALECTRAVRRAVGPDVELMVDMHGRTTPAEAIALARQYREMDIYFLEEPVPPENIPALAEVKQLSGLRIATGERLYTRFGFREVLERRAADILQPDLCHCGGILEAKKIAAMGEPYYVLVSPHNPNGPVSTAAGVQFAMSTQNFDMLEYLVEDVPWREEIFPDGFKIENGYIVPSGKPGLGIEFDEEAARRHPAIPADLPVCHLPDGTVAEW